MGPVFRQSSEGPTRVDAVSARRLRALPSDRETDRGAAPRGGRGYEAMDDPVELGIALRELRRVRAWIEQFAETATEMPDFALESVVGVKAAAGMVTLLIDRAEARLEFLTSHNASHNASNNASRNISQHAAAAGA